jgi:hypothetical protein
MRPLGAKLSLPLSQDSEGSTPLHLAALYGHTRICEILIRETEAPDLVFMPDAQGNTPLHCAALGKNCDTLDAILMRGGQVASTNLKYPFYHSYFVIGFDQTLRIKPLFTWCPCLRLRVSLCHMLKNPVGLLMLCVCALLC